MPISQARPAKSNPGSFAFLALLAAAWVFTAIWAGATLWPEPDSGDKGPAVVAILLCSVGATVAAGASAIVHQVAQRRVDVQES